MLTAGAYEALVELDLTVPEDVALAGFGPAPRSALERQDLTMVGLPAEEMGYRTGRLLLERVRVNVPPTAGSRGAASAPVHARRPVRERFPVELPLSRSCGCPLSVTGVPNPTGVPSVLNMPSGSSSVSLMPSVTAAAHPVS